MEKINESFVRQCVPHFIFFERVLTRGEEIFTFLIAHGYGYLLKRFVCRYDGVEPGTGKIAPELKVEFFDNYNGRARQIVPSPLSLLSTPNNGGGVEYEVQQVGQPHTFTVKTPRLSEKILNFNYPYNDVLRFRISGGGVPVHTYTGDVYPSIWIMLDGYFVPEVSLELWEKREQEKAGKGAQKWLKL